MRTTTILVATLALFAGIALVAPAATADAPQVQCTLSYPGTCTAAYEDVRVKCGGVGAVPNCDL